MLTCILYHIYRAGSGSSFSFSLRVADGLVVIGFIKREQRDIDQRDHQNRVHFTKELTYLKQRKYIKKTKYEAHNIAEPGIKMAL